jgi:hypothetical protein
MTLSRLSALVRPALVVAAVALLADLLLDWREASIRTPAVAVDGGTWGLSGWGAVAAVLLLVYVIVEARSRRPVAAPVLALLGGAFAVVEFFTGDASVVVEGAASVDTDRLWPAYLGLVLALAVVVGAAIRLADALQTPGLTRAHPTP